MTKTAKRNLCIFIVVLVLATFVVLFYHSLLNIEAESVIDYSQTIVIKNHEGGYQFGNNSVMIQTETLQEALNQITNAIPENSIGVIFFENVETAEYIVLNGVKTLLFNGAIKSSATDGYSYFIIVENNSSLILQGLNLTSQITAIKVMQGGELYMNSGNVIVEHESQLYTCHGIIVDGFAKISGGIIRYDSKYTSGSALYQGHYASNVVIEGETTALYGNSGIVCASGEITINGGTISATHPTESNSDMAGNTSSGYGVFSTSSGTIIMNGGKIKSVSTENTVYLSGNIDSLFTFNGGEIFGKIKIFAKNESAQLNIKGRIFQSIHGIGILITSDSTLMVDNGILTHYASDGYQLKYWYDSMGRVENQSPTINSLAMGRVEIIANNTYQVTFTLGDMKTTSEHAFGDIIKVSDYAPQCPEGIEIVHWTRNGTVVDDTVMISGANEFIAVLTLTKASFERLDNQVFIHNGKDFKIQMIATHPIASITYSWEKLQGEDFVEVSNQNPLIVKNCDESGVYRCKIIAQKEDLFSFEYTNEITVLIEKGDYQEVESPTLTGVYSPIATLSSYSLPEGFSWVSPSIIPTVSKVDYEVVYCGDSDNFNPYYTVAKLTLEKAKVEGPVHHDTLSGAIIEEGKVISDHYALSQDFYWVNPQETPAYSKNVYDIFYNPDRENYYDHYLTVSVYFIKGEYQNVSDVRIQVQYLPNLTLAKLTLPEGYSFADEYFAIVTIPAIGEYEYALEYNPKPDYFNTFTGAKLYLTVTKGLPNTPITLPQFEGVYHVDYTLSEISLPNGYSWQNPDFVLVAGEHEVNTFYNPDPINYVNLLLTVRVCIKKALPENVDTELSFEIDYRKGLTLSALELPENYQWTTDHPLVAGESPVVFNAEYVLDDANYERVPVEVSLLVRKGTLDMSTFSFGGIFEFVYNGKPQNATCSGILPEGVIFGGYEGNDNINTGSYKVRCILIQLDTQNYHLIPEYYAEVIIKKAKGEIVGAVNQVLVYDGTEKKVDVKLNNTEQTLLSDSNNAFIDVGVYEITFSAEESANYLATEKHVVVEIKNNKLEQTFADGRVFSVVDQTFGFSDTARLTIFDVVTTKTSYKISFAIEENGNGGSFAISMSLPDDYLLRRLKEVRDEKGQPLSFVVNRDNSITVYANVTGELTFLFEKEVNLGLILGLSLGGGAFVCIVVVMLIFTPKWRKKYE